MTMQEDRGVQSGRLESVRNPFELVCLINEQTLRTGLYPMYLNLLQEPSTSFFSPFLECTNIMG